MTARTLYDKLCDSHVAHQREDGTALLFAQVLHAASFGSFHAAAIGVVHRFFPGRHQARGQAIYGSLAFGVGGAIGGFASGYSWEGLGPELTFSLASACALAGLLLIAWKLQPASRN